MFIIIGEMQNFSTSIRGILFGDTNVRKTSDKIPNSDGRARKEKGKEKEKSPSALIFLNEWANVRNF
jgi:hypothetical protein